MRRRSSQSGFALLMALVLVLMAGTVLAGVAWRSTVGALESQDAVEELQRRWAVTSCRATLLQRIEQILDEAEHGLTRDGEVSETYLNEPLAELRVSGRLAGMDYELVLTDEQAKLNLNYLLLDATRGEAQSVVSRLIREAAEEYREPVDVSLRTLAVGDHSPRETQSLPEVGGYGQVFDHASPGHLVGDEAGTGLAATITCWGDGKVNLRRASKQVIEQACNRHLGPKVVGELLAARNDDPYRALSTTLSKLTTIDDTDKAKVGDYLTDRSNCHGLWVIAKGPQRSWHTLVIGIDDGLNIRQRYEFEW